ncbi:MAG TPA: YcaO-like family protein [Stackebrandtia sp.]|jgi:ribosomal protein S12 methylthiotransferase accessory factor|uniref:YcaO-like family protein n=1 Tax=Stackebrandtia sp. TaxID=2023065 RepID=UPI002D22423B|nr:YcaO-like family protein [Stackebrandtia sp.]HZE41730.1 YcaO-like family protein [Stackebrandtia sp.]
MIGTDTNLAVRGVPVDDAAYKSVVAGTHRTCAPERTLARIVPLLPRMGITRLSDVTWLDDIGVPVFQAVRPNSYTISVSQGKGLTPDLAKVSAAMESIETWHAERLPPGDTRDTVAAIAPELDYGLDELPLLPRHHLNPGATVEWGRARRLIDGTDTLVPMECLRLDGRTSARWQLPLFHTTSNGLASGNTVGEATLHALYEVIERDAIARAATADGTVVVDLDSVGGDAAELIERLRAAEVAVRVDVLPSPTGVACVRARIVSDAFPYVFEGMGAHLDRDVAFCRAVTEAVQSRVTAISGARDDMRGDWYRRAGLVAAGRSGTPDLEPLYRNPVRTAFGDVPSVRHATLGEDLTRVAHLVRGHTGRDPLVVDHTRPDIGIAVVRVVCPGLRYNPEAG